MLKVGIFNGWYKLFLRLTWSYLHCPNWKWSCTFSQVKMTRTGRWSSVRLLWRSMTARSIFCPLTRLASAFSGVQRSVCSGNGWTAACLPCLDCEKPSTSTLQRNVRLNGSYIHLRTASFRLFATNVLPLRAGLHVVTADGYEQKWYSLPRTSFLVELASTSSPRMVTSINDILWYDINWLKY